MKISIIGNNLTALVLAKVLLKKKIQVDLFYEENTTKNLKSVRTIGITQSNVLFLNKHFKGIEKIGHKIDKISISTERQKNDLLNFEKNSDFKFAVFKYENIYKFVKSSLKKEKNFKSIKTKLDKKLVQKKYLLSYDLVIDINLRNTLSKKFFSRKIKKDYFSRAYVTIINHKQIKNNIAKQIFSSSGPLAFLPISNNKTSLVYSIFDNNNSKINEEKVIDLIKNYNTKYKITSFEKFESFKLQFSLLRNYFKQNVLAFGDQAHTIHPLAGQGFNMTLRDIKYFLKLIDEKIKYGLNLDSSILEEFEKNNKYKNVIFANSIDFIHEFFKFEKKLPEGLSEKLFLYFNKNSAFKKYISIFADRGF